MARPTVASQKRLMTRKRLLIISVLSGIVIVFVLFSKHGLLSRWRLSGERTDLVTEIKSIKSSEDSLRTLIGRLENDTIAIERLARERYGYVRPGEKVYRIDRDTTEDEE